MSESGVSLSRHLGGQVIRPKVLTNTNNDDDDTSMTTMAMNNNGNGYHVTRMASYSSEGASLHKESVQFHVSAFGRSMTLELQLNKELFGRGYVEVTNRPFVVTIHC
jgi:hypothetical protein